MILGTSLAVSPPHPPVEKRSGETALPLLSFSTGGENDHGVCEERESGSEYSLPCSTFYLLLSLTYRDFVRPDEFIGTLSPKPKPDLIVPSHPDRISGLGVSGPASIPT